MAAKIGKLQQAGIVALSHRPPGPRKGGMPLSTEIPVPVKAVRQRAERMRVAAALIWADTSKVFIGRESVYGLRRECQGSKSSARSLLQASEERLHLLVVLKITMGGTCTPSQVMGARYRAGQPCQKTVRAKNNAWPGRRRLTRTNSEKKMRMP